MRDELKKLIDESGDGNIKLEGNIVCINCGDGSQYGLKKKNDTSITCYNAQL